MNDSLDMMYAIVVHHAMLHSHYSSSLRSNIVRRYASIISPNEASMTEAARTMIEQVDRRYPRQGFITRPNGSTTGFGQSHRRDGIQRLHSANMLQHAASSYYVILK
jgi:hypothetical protein